jgi:starch synthase
MTKESLLFCASEIYPFAKTGGLADVAHSLPRALRDTYNIKVVMPLYSCIEQKKYEIKPLNKDFCIIINNINYTIELFACNYEGVEYIFIYSSLLCDREFLYGTPTEGYSNNALRFTIFCHAIVELLRANAYDIVHLNDWQTALVPLLLQEEPLIKTKTLFTIHNLAYQGLFTYEVLNEIGIDSKYFTIDILEFYNQVNFMKAAIAYSDAITTVSQSYADEILSAKFGCGLDGFLRYHKNKLTGIINGIDIEHFTPSNDKLLEYPFTNLTEKKLNKKDYLKQKNLKGITKPLFIFIGRFTQQKGVDLLIDSLEEMALNECNIAILGDGETLYQEKIKEIVDRYDNIHFEFKYNEVLSHQMYAAADFLLMPSLFEPCGLNQMIAMSYGSIPIVHKVGGLKDTVYDYNLFEKESIKGYGILFDKVLKESLINSFNEAINLYSTKKEYNKIVKHNMLCDFSWKNSAEQYVKLYKQL